MSGDQPAEQAIKASEPKSVHDSCPSYASSVTQPVLPSEHHHGEPPGRGESAIPADKQEESLENILDDWEDDPDNARNWSFRRKWTSVIIVSIYTFAPPLASSMMAPGLQELATKYNITNPTVVALSLSIFLLTFALGPLVLAPLSEMYGRKWVLHINNIFSIGFNLGCAFAPTAGSFIGFRFLCGLSGSAPIACGGGVVGDLFSERDRASAMAIYSVGPLFGPAIGPVIGGFVAQYAGVKWIFVIIAALCAFCSLIGILLLEETYAPIIRARRAKKSNDPEKKAVQFHPTLDNTSKLHYLWINLSRPVILLTRSFICFILSLYMAFTYGIYYLMFTTFPSLFGGVYGLSVSMSGLVYLGVGIGLLGATFLSARVTDRLYYYLAQKNNGVGTPEMRIPALFFGSFFIPIGVFWYGWSAAAHIHWIMPIIGTAIFGFGMMMTFLPIQLYLVDSFTYAASALAACSVLRSMLGFAFPLFADQMFVALGVGGGNSLLGGLAIVLGIPFPVWIYYKGASIRAKSNLTR